MPASWGDTVMQQLDNLVLLLSSLGTAACLSPDLHPAEDRPALEPNGNQLSCCSGLQAAGQGRAGEQLAKVGLSYCTSCSNSGAT
jgi:hypothetical protein